MSKVWKALREATHGQEVDFARRYTEQKRVMESAGFTVEPKYTVMEWIRSNPVIPTLPRLTDKTA